MAEETSPQPVPNPAPVPSAPDHGPLVTPVEAPTLPAGKTVEELRAERMERYRHEYGKWGAPVVNFIDRAANTVAGIGSAINNYLVFAWTSGLLLNARFWRLFPWGEKVEIVHSRAVGRENPLLSKGVLDTFMYWGAMLTAMLVFECWTWSSTFRYALGDDHPYQVALVTFVFAWAVVNVDRQILIADIYARSEALPSPKGAETPKESVLYALYAKIVNPLRKKLNLTEIDPKRTAHYRANAWSNHVTRLSGSSGVRQMMIRRIVILLAISVVNAVPVELKVLEPDLESKIAAQERVTQATVRTTAEARVHTSADARRTQENTRYNGELQSYNVERERQRLEMVNRHNGIITQDRATTTSLRQQSDDEYRNGGIRRDGSRRPGGAGTSYDGITAREQQHTTVVARHNAEISAEQEQFTAATTAHRSELAATNAANLERIRLDEEGAVNHIISPRFLTEHESEWKKSRGFLARFMALLELEHESFYAKVIIWASRAIITILGMLFLFFKMGARQEVLIYLSTAHQAKHGNTKAQAQLRGRGINDFDAFARDPSVKAANAIWSGLAIQVAQKLNALEGEKCKLARAELPGSFSYSRTEIHGKLRELFVTEVLPSLLEQKDFADFLASQGIEHEAAKSFLTTFDANVNGENLWRVTPEELTALGWKDPQPDRDMLEKKMDEYTTLQMNLLHSVSDWMFRLISFGDKNTPSLEVITAGQQAYQALQGNLLEMARLEALFTKRATPIPPWGKDGDPRDKLMSLMVGNGPLTWLKQNTMWEDPTPELDPQDFELDPATVTNGSGEHLIAPRQTPPPIPPETPKASSQEAS